jgi:hypothetical protein
MIAVAPVFFWELSRGLWLTFKGLKPAPLTAGIRSSMDREPAAAAV